jgi:TP901 family phage tail tape measure protein
MEVFRLFGSIFLNDNASSELQAVESRAKGLGDKFGAIGKKMESAGKSMTAKVTAPLVGLGTAAIMTSVKFDDAMSSVAAISQASGTQLDQLREAAKKMGSETRFSATEAADALGYLALAGWDTEKSISALPKVLSLAQAGGLDLAYASDLVTDSMSALGLEFNELDRFADELARTSQKSNASVSQLGEAILTVGGTAKVLAGGTNELSTALGILADDGTKGAEGGTLLRNVILSLTAPTDKAAKKMKELGVEVADADGNMRPLNDTFKDLDAALSYMSEIEKTQVLNELFNKVDLKGVNSLLAATNGRFEELSGLIEDSEGAAAEMAATMEDNLGGAFRSLSSSVAGLLIQIGEHLTPMVQKAAEFLTKLAGRFSNLSDSQQKTIIIIGLIVAAIGPLLLIIGKTIAIVTTMIATVTKLIAIFKTVMVVFKTAGVIIAGISAPILLIIAGVVALIAIGVLLYKNWDTVVEYLGKAWQWMKDTAVSVFDWLIEFFREWGTLVLAIITGPIGILVYLVHRYWDEIKEFTLNIWNSIKDFFVEYWDLLFAIITGPIGILVYLINNYWDEIKAFTIQIWDSVKEYFIRLWEDFKNLFGNTIGFLSDSISKGWNWIKDTTSTAWNGIKDGISGAWNKIKDGTSSSTNWLKDNTSKAWNSIRDNSVKLWNGIRDFFKEWWKEILVIMTGPIGAIVYLIHKNWDKIKETTLKVWNSIKDFIANIWNGIQDFVGKSLDWVRDRISGAWNKVKDITTSAWEGIKKAIKTPIDWIMEQVDKVFGAIDRVKNAAKAVTDVGGAVTGAATGAAKAAAGAVTGTARRALSIIPGLQDGGNVERAGRVLVGERGPELLDLPRGARVTPLDQTTSINHTGTIRVEGVNNQGELMQSIEIIIEDIVDSMRREARLV